MTTENSQASNLSNDDGVISDKLTKGLKILMLEDTPDDADLIKRELRKAAMQFTAIVVTEKDDFETALMEFEPDVVLADHALPQYNSIEAFDLFGKFRAEKGAAIPFILVTGHVSEEFAIRMLKAGVDDYVLKTGLKRLPSAIESALEKCRVEKERASYHNRIMRMESLMREAEQLAHFGSWDVDLITGKYTWSDETYRIYGYQPGEVEPSYELYISMVHPDDVCHIRALQATAMEKLAEDEYEFRIIDRQGFIKYIDCKVMIRRNAEGRPIRVVGFNIDVTKRVCAEESLREKEQVYRSLFEENPDVVFSVDREGKFSKVNDAFACMVGSSIEALKGTDFRQVLHKSEFGRVYPYLLSAMDRKPQRYRTNFVNGLGKKVLLDVTVMPIAVDGKIVGVHCIAKNLTQRIRDGGASRVAVGQRPLRELSGIF